jgi:hypothetical protein
MVKTYMRIPGACLPRGVLFSDTPQGRSRVQGFFWQGFGVDFNFPKNGMWFTVNGVLGILEECQLHQ